MSAPQFIEFGDRIVNVSRIVSMAPPVRTADGYELDARVDGFSFKEIYDDIDEAVERFTSLATVLLGEAPSRRDEELLDPARLRAMLTDLVADAV
ncbi:MAG TPA: hypothetical protein VFK42_10965 [Acidimicrobiales bacterium]|jgi:hypothetical protein|nr:hypothetical protein [Acidimicrobiales bacterium]